MAMTPEAAARVKIDAALEAAGWTVQDAKKATLGAGRGIALREFPLKHGYADYLLYVDRKAVGAVEAKKVGATLTGVEIQSTKYGDGLPDGLPAWVRPLPFLYESTGVETRFTNRLDPDPRSREVFHFHRPETLAEWAQAATGGTATTTTNGKRAAETPAPYIVPTSLRGRLHSMPPIVETGLWPAQIQAVRGLEASLQRDHPRSLIQMATGSGKTITAISAIYRLIKFGGARRVLFLVDRANLGRQTLKEFQSYRAPDDGRTFTELYKFQSSLADEDECDSRSSAMPVSMNCFNPHSPMKTSATRVAMSAELRAHKFQSSLADEDECDPRRSGAAWVAGSFNPHSPMKTSAT